MDVEQHLDALVVPQLVGRPIGISSSVVELKA